MTPLEQGREIADAIRAAVPGADVRVLRGASPLRAVLSVSWPDGEPLVLHLDCRGARTKRHPPTRYSDIFGETRGTAWQIICAAVRFLLGDSR
jgi:hypothetical protein